MAARHPKTIRREILLFLYEYFHQDPHGMATPEEFLASDRFERDDLPPNTFYLHERGLIELMHGYTPPMFAAARITTRGIDLVENEREFNLRFPKRISDIENTSADVPYLLEKLVEEADLSALDGENRRSLLRDVEYLRDELSRPVQRWRRDVVMTVLNWIEGYFDDLPDERLPAAAELRQRVLETLPTPRDM